MKILVCSDCHGDYAALNQIYLSNSDVDIFYNLGDNELPEYLLHNFLAIKGNCDFNSLPLEANTEVEGFKVHMEHGNNFLFHMNANKYIENKDCDIFLFGHTHKKLASKVGNTYVFNPGSLSRPRDGDKGSYLILELKENEPIKYEFKEVKE